MRHLDGRAENGVKNPQMLGVVGPRLLWSVGLQQMVAHPQCSPEPLNRTGRPFVHPPPSGPENLRPQVQFAIENETPKNDVPHLIEVDASHCEDHDGTIVSYSFRVPERRTESMA